MGGGRGRGVVCVYEYESGMYACACVACKIVVIAESTNFEVLCVQEESLVCIVPQGAKPVRCTDCVKRAVVGAVEARSIVQDCLNRVQFWIGCGPEDRGGDRYGGSKFKHTTGRI